MPIRRSALLRRYICLNILFVLVPVLILVCVYMHGALDQIIQEHEASLSHALQQSQRGIDADMNAFRLVASQISIDPDVTPYQLKQGQYDTVTALKTLKGYHAHANFLESLMLYLRGGGKLYAGAGIMDVRLMGTGHYPFVGGWNQEGLYTLLERAAPYGFSPTGMGVRFGTTDCMVITYPWARPTLSPIGSVVGILPMDYFAQNLFRPESDAAIYTALRMQTGQWLYCDGDPAMFEAVAGLSQEKGMRRVRHEAEWVTVFHFTSEQTGWTYLALLPHGQFTQRLLSDRSLAITWLSVLLLVCVAAGILIAVRNYLPIRRLDELAVAAPESGGKGHKDELRRIGASLQQLATANQLMRQEQLLYKLLYLHGRDPEKLIGLLRQAGIHLKAPCCTLLLSGKPMLAPAQREQILLSIREGFPSTYAVELGINDYIAVVCNLGDQTVERTAAALLAALQGAPPVPLRLACGRPYANPGQIGRSLSQAISAMETATGTETVVCFTQSEMGHAGERWVRFNTKLSQWLQQGNADLVQEALAEITDVLQDESVRGDALRMRYVAGSVTQALLAAYRQAGEPLAHETADQLVHFSDPRDFLEMLRTLCVRLLDALHQQHSQRQNEQFLTMLAYIDAHYCDANFSLKSMAVDLNLTNSYLSRFFRDHADMNFSDYVTKLRMEQACRLMEDRSLRIREVVERVGYVDVASFTRKFTQVMGISPGRYRDNPSNHSVLKGEEA